MNEVTKVTITANVIKVARKEQIEMEEEVSFIVISLVFVPMHVTLEGIELEHSTTIIAIIIEFVVAFIATLVAIIAVVLEKKLKSLPVQERSRNYPFLRS